MDEFDTHADRRRIGGLFLIVALLAPLLALLPPDGTLTPVAVAVYVTLTAITGVVSWRLWGRLDVVVGPTAVLYVVAVAGLRHAEGGGASGLAPLLLLALFWCSLVGSRRSLLLVIASMAAALLVPIVVFGDPRYPVTEWRRAIIWLTVAPVVGWATLGLRQHVETARELAAEHARTDALTGCLNRRGVDVVATRELARARRTGSPLTVALIDVDHFKRFNDTNGHDAGDILLRDAASAWSAALRDTDVLARWGGEEFLVLLPDTPQLAAVDVLERLRASTPGDQTCSVGIAVVLEGDTLTDTVGRADEALYAAKAQGRDRIVTTA